MKTCIIAVFLALAVNGALATFPLPYFSLGLIPQAHNFFYNAPPAFGAQAHFFAYPQAQQVRRNLYNPYQPLSYAQPQRYSYYEPPQAPRYPTYPTFPTYPEYVPAPETSQNSVVQYVYQQTPLQPVPSKFEEPMKNLEPVLEVLKKVAEEPKPEQVPQLMENPNNSESVEAIASPATSANDSKAEESAESVILEIDESEPEPEKSMEPTPNVEPEEFTAKPTEDHKDDATPSTEETPIEAAS